MSETSPPVVARNKNTHHLNQFFSVLSFANITGGPRHLDVLALQQSHSSVHIGLPPTAHHHMGSFPTQGLSCSETNSGEEEQNKNTISVKSVITFCTLFSGV